MTLLFAVLGYIAAIFVLAYVTLDYFVVFMNCMGEYNIGGVPNTQRARRNTIIAGLVLLITWGALLVAPFV